MKWFLLLLLSLSAFAGDPIIWGPNKAKNVTNELQFNNGVQLLTGTLDPSSSAVSATTGSLYFSTNGTTYVKQDSGLTTNWLPFAASAGGTISTINGQSGPTVSIVAGTSGTNFNVASSSNTITLNLPTASATNRGALSTSDWSTFNAKEPAITAGTGSQYWRGDKTFQTLDTSVVPENGNLYYTSGRFDSAFAGKSTTDLAEGTNLYYTPARFDTALSAKTTTDLAEGSNLYFTEARVRDAVLTGLSAVTNAAITASDSVLSAFGKLQAQVNQAITDIAGKEPAFSILGLSKGGTNKNMTAVAGGVVYTDADSQEVTAAGLAGRILQSNGSSAPTWVVKSILAKANAKSAVTAQTIAVPNNQLSLIGNNNERLIETGNRNLLENPSFEDFGGVSTGTPWALPGSYSYVLDSTPIDGSYSLTVNHVTQPVTIPQDSTLYEAQFADGIQGLAMAYVKTSITSTPIYVCPRRAGSLPSSLTSGCVQVNANGKYGLYKVPFILGGTSNGIEVTSNGVNVTGDVTVDAAFVGAVDLKQDIPTSYTQKTYISGGAFTASDIFYTTPTTTYGTGVYTVNAGTGIYTALQDSVVTVTWKGISNSATQVIPEIVMNGNVISSAHGVGGSSQRGSVTAVDYVPSGGTFQVRNIQGTGSAYTVTVTARTVTNSSVYTANCGANCVDVFTFKVSSTGVVSNENSDFINGNCSVASNAFTCSFNSSLGLTTAPNCVVTTASSTNDFGVRAISTSTSSLTYNTVNTSTVGAVATAVNVSCQKSGADFTATRTIIGTFKDSVTSQGSNTLDVQTVYFGSGANCISACTTGNCTICRQNGSKITSVSFVSTANYDINGIDGTKYTCSGSAFAGGNYGVIIQDLTNSTSSKARIIAGAYTSGANAGYAQVTCIGTP